MLRTNVVDNFAIGRVTATADTAFVALIPPYCGAKGEARRLFSVDTGRTMANPSQTALTGFPNWWGPDSCFTHLTTLLSINGSTSHQYKIMRPLNWTYITAAVAANATTCTVKEDPGVYSTNYRYPSPLSTGTARVANNTIASGDYVCYQTKDGTWVLDTTTGLSGSTLTFATAVPNITGGGIAAGTPLFFFGINTDSDPATGVAHPGLDTTVSVTQVIQDIVAGSLHSSLHRGDPIMLYNANATAADILAAAAGIYTKDW